MQLKLLTASSELLETLYSNPLDQAGEDGHQMAVVSEPISVPGATGGWFELLVEFGVVGVPVAILCNLIASWIWKALTANDRLLQKQPSKLILRQGALFAEVEIDPENYERTRAALETALAHVNHKP